MGHTHKLNVCPEIRNNISYVSHDLSVTMHLALPLAKKDQKRSIYFVPTVELVLWKTKKKNETIMCPREVYGPVGWRGSPLMATRAEAGLREPKMSDPGGWGLIAESHEYGWVAKSLWSRSESEGGPSQIWSKGRTSRVQPGWVVGVKEPAPQEP